MQLPEFLSAARLRVDDTAIRRLVEVSREPGMISFGGGLPSSEAFPAAELAEAARKIIETKGARALQYGPPEGTSRLRGKIVELLDREEGISAAPSNILVTTASQQALDLICRTFLDPGDPAVVELPSYIGGLQALRACGAELIGVPTDEAGVVVHELEEALHRRRDRGHPVKMVYLVPDFQNPKGVTLSHARRERVARLAERMDVLLVEDSPYRQLRFEEEPGPMLFGLVSGPHVISVFSFSKILAPGLRLGFVLAHEDVIRELAVLKQPLDMCTSPLTQLMAAELLDGGRLQDHVQGVRELYRGKRELMLQALEAHMPAGISWTRPRGGLFLWVTLPGELDADELLAEAVEEKVAYIPGSAFHCDGGGRNTLRLNFTFTPDADIPEGIQRLGRVLTRALAR